MCGTGREWPWQVKGTYWRFSVAMALCVCVCVFKVVSNFISLSVFRNFLLCIKTCVKYLVVGSEQDFAFLS